MLFNWRNDHIKVHYCIKLENKFFKSSKIFAFQFEKLNNAKDQVF